MQTKNDRNILVCRNVPNTLFVHFTSLDLKYIVFIQKFYILLSTSLYLKNTISWFIIVTSYLIFFNPGKYSWKIKYFIDVLENKIFHRRKWNALNYKKDDRFPWFVKFLSTLKKPSKNYTCFILRRFGLFLIHLQSKT